MTAARRRRYLADGADVRVVAVRRDRAATIRSYARWTEPGGAAGSLRSRDHWRAHDGFDHQFDEWDLTFPKTDAPTKEAAITVRPVRAVLLLLVLSSSRRGPSQAYYDAYDAGLAKLERDFRGRVLVLESPRLFDDAALQRDLFAFLGVPGAAPVVGLHANAQAYA